MLKISGKEYFDKIYGCFLGKALIGNIGAVYEGMKQYLEIDFSENFFKEIIPNDDLDLQVLWLEVLEKKGEYFTSRDLADIFYEKCPYAPGEYAMFKRNYEKGIYPPYSGSFGAGIFENGMGSPIRSEIWACIAPNNPALAAKFARMDSCLDHRVGSDSENGEIFFAAMEALAFSKHIPSDGIEEFLLEMIREAQKFIPGDCKLNRLINDTLQWYSESGDFAYTRGMIIRFYGDAEATSCYQNIGFIVLSLLKGRMDLIECGMNALRCGFDTDCTCATVGGILGIVYGAEEMGRKYGLTSAVYKLGVKTVRRSDTVKSLSEDISAVGYYFSKTANHEVEIKDYEGKQLSVEKPADKVRLSVQYIGEPSIAFGEKKEAVLRVENLTDAPLRILVQVSSLTGLELSVGRPDNSIPAEASVNIPIRVKVPETLPYLPAANKLVAEVETCGEKYVCDFGYSGERQWRIAGPFWRNIVDVPPLKAGESYWSYVANAKIGNMQPIDLIRHYHTNSLPDCGDWEPDEVFGKERKSEAQFFARIVNTQQSDFVLEDYEKFNGQANYYLKTVVFSENEKKVGLQIGFSDTCKVWLNGKLVAHSYGSVKFTYENLHLDHVILRKGENELVVMLSKIGEVTRFSFDFVKESACSDHVTDISTKNLEC